jgi:hypothetical protein
MVGRVWSLMFLTAEPPAAETGFSLERYATPYLFAPRLSLAGAAVAVAGAVARIFLGALLFAVWAAYSFAAGQALGNPVARLLLAVVSLAGFLAAFAILMIAISWLVKKLRLQP